MNDVFISYKSENRKTAIEYFKILKSQGINAWFDQLIPKNKKWDNEIKSNIIDSKLFICIISKEVVKDKKWLVNQISVARRYNKRILFVNIDNTPIKEFKKLKIKEAVYNSIEEINFQDYFKEEAIFDDYIRLSDISYKKLNRPFFIGLVLSLLSIVTFFYGINVFNLRIEKEVSYLIMGVLAMFILSIKPKKENYFINAVIALLLLASSMYIIEPFYVTDISIIPMIYLLIYFFVFLVRYSNMKNRVLNILVSLAYSLFLIAFTSCVNIFFIYLFDLDVSLFNYVMLIGFIVSTYYNAEVHFKVYKEFKYVEYYMNGKNLVEMVEDDYED